MPVQRLDEAQLGALMVRYQSGDVDAAGELIHHLSGILLHFLSGPKATRQFAEDLVQECWLQIHRSRQSYRPGEPVLPWIFSIAWHVRRNAFRRLSREQSRHAQHAEMLPQSERPATAPVVLEDLLRHLPDAQRRTVELLKLQGKTLNETAEETSSTVGAVKQRAHRALRTLRHLLTAGVLD